MKKSIALLALLMTICLPASHSVFAAEVDRVCALPGYPKKQSTGINIFIDHTNNVFGYEVIAPNVINNEPLVRLTLRINDGDKKVALIPLQIERQGSPESSSESRAFFRFWSTRFTLIVDAEYGFPCSLTVEKVLNP